MAVSIKDWTPEQRAAAKDKAAATRAAKKATPEIPPHATVTNNADFETRIESTSDESFSFTRPEIVIGEQPEEAGTAPLGDGGSNPDPFQLFLLSLDAETRNVLDDDELRDIYSAQVAKALAEKKAAKKKIAAELALNAARMEAGLVPMATQEEMALLRRNNEIVRATIELPPSGEQGEVPDIGLRIDQKVFLHGASYPFTRAQWDSYREIMYRAGQHELEFRGNKTRQRRWIMSRAQSFEERFHVNLNADGGLA